MGLDRAKAPPPTAQNGEEEEEMHRVVMAVHVPRQGDTVCCDNSQTML